MLEKSLNENAAPPQRDFSYKSSRLKSPSASQRNISYKKAAKEIYNVTSDCANDYDTFMNIWTNILRNFSHFLSTNENGIKVVLYMTLLTAMLLMIYKRKNEIGYSDAKFCFKIEMEAWITALSITITGGDISKFSNRYRIRNRIP